MTIKGLPEQEEQRYYRLISKIESGDNPNAKASTSTASGRFQFIKSTWEGLGYKWSDVFDDAKQWQAIEKFTAQNAQLLAASGCAINFATLYGAHFLGVGGFLNIMRANRSDPISVATSAAQRKANPSILKGTVGDFCNWLEKKTGDDVAKRYATVTPLPQPPKAPIPVDPVPEPIQPKKGLSWGGIIFVALVTAVVAGFFVVSQFIQGN